MAKKLKQELRQISDRAVLDNDYFDWWLSAKGWAWEMLDRGEYGVTLDEAKLLCVWEDPVLWLAAFVDDPDTGNPYTFWDYQIPSVRAWHQDVVHQDGAEVGKTREIIGLVLWGGITGFGFSYRQPSMLIGAPMQTHLDEIIMAVEEVVGVSDALPDQKSILKQFWAKPKKHPHYLMRFIIPNFFDPSKPGISRVYYRPAGHDGTAFRGVHVNAAAFMDEAAKIPADVCWTEFRRAKKPGCVERMYSVPDGRRNTLYYNTCMRAVPNLEPGKPGVRLFKWPKTLMPAPFWSEERRRKFVDDYGGIDSPGYLRNVLGEHGQPEDTVFPWSIIVPSLRDVPEYRGVKLIAEPNTNALNIEGYRIELEITQEGNKISHKHLLADRAETLDQFTGDADRTAVRNRVRDMLREFFTPPTHVAELYFGADLGYSRDPSEFMLWSRTGQELRRIGRLSLKGASYDLQCEIIFCLDELFGFNGNWCIDLGNAGIAVMQIMQSSEIFDDGNYQDRMMGIQFAEVRDAIDEDGNIVEKENNEGDTKILRLPMKQLATDLWLRRYQRHHVTQPYDNDVIQDYMGHTARAGNSDKLIYNKENDHTIDADRAALLGKVLHEGAGVDVFLTGACIR
jgi:hypothetical protein